MMFQGYGRGAGMIEKFAPKEMANDKTFDVWIKPHGPSGSQPAVQVDEEPWMLFKAAKHQKKAIEFLKFFYRNDNYLEYVSTVPIHLFPITKSLHASPKYQGMEMIQRWRGWIELQQGYLDKDQGKPTLVVDWTDMTEKPYLMDVLASRILRDMVMDVVLDRMEPEDAAQKAQKRLESFMRTRGYLKE
jgi:multiple sugar transport system substrate-binding protein